MDTLTRMRAFIDVVEAEGFSAAARKIGRSKALLSKYVRELEDELGALLINRTTRQFSLTEAGHTYYARASELVKEIDSLAESVRETAGWDSPSCSAAGVTPPYSTTAARWTRCFSSNFITDRYAVWTHLHSPGAQAAPLSSMERASVRE